MNQVLQALIIQKTRQLEPDLPQGDHFDSDAVLIESVAEAYVEGLVKKVEEFKQWFDHTGRFQSSDEILLKIDSLLLDYRPPQFYSLPKKTLTWRR